MDKFPEQSNKDYISSTVKGVVSAIPVAGGPLSVLFETVFSTPLDKRKKEWFQSLADAIEELTKKVDGITPEALSQNEVFISVSMQATQIALRNHQKEKLDALRNAVINSTNTISLDENKLLMFTRIIDDMTPLHLKVLEFLNNPNKFEQELQNRTSNNMRTHYPDNMNIWKEYYPELNSSRELITQVCKELYAKGFLFNELQLLGTGKVTSGFGEEFLAFISE
ncbi:hypothetical protein KKC15_09815 [bacterium]|nr:hypothetical protein [bacterium]